MRILLVDDTEELRELMSYFLGKSIKDAQIVTAENGAEALVILETVKFDLVVTDCNMPVMNGIDFVAKAREAGLQIPIFMWSGEVAPKAPGINGFYAKDDRNGLIDAIKACA